MTGSAVWRYRAEIKDNKLPPDRETPNVMNKSPGHAVTIDNGRSLDEVTVRGEGRAADGAISLSQNGQDLIGLSDLLGYVRNLANHARLGIKDQGNGRD